MPWVLFAGILAAVAAWNFVDRPLAQQPSLLVQLQNRVQKLEQENQQDYRALQDLYQRNQLFERKLEETRTNLRNRFTSLTNENANLRRQLVEITQQLQDRNRRTTGYPRIHSTRTDRNGNVILDFVR